MSDAVQAAPAASDAQVAAQMVREMRSGEMTQVITENPAPVEEETKPIEEAPGTDEEPAPAENEPEGPPQEEAPAVDGEQPASRWTQLKERAEQAEQNAQLVEARLSEASDIANQWYAETQKVEAERDDLRFELQDREAYVAHLENILAQAGYKHDPRDVQMRELQRANGKLQREQQKQQLMAQQAAERAAKQQIDAGAQVWVQKIKDAAKAAGIEAKDLALAYSAMNRLENPPSLEDVAKRLALLSPKNQAKAAAAKANAAAPRLPVRAGAPARVPFQSDRDEAVALITSQRRAG